MRRLLFQILLPVLAVVLLTQTANAQWGYWGSWNWWGGYRPAYSSYYAPAYSTYYGPSFYSTSYVPSISYYAPSCNSCSSCSSGSCGSQSCCYVPSTCCSPCNSCSSCVSCGGDGCSNCSSGDCGLASSNNSAPTPVKSRDDSTGTPGRTPTFIEEQDRGSGTNYDNKTKTDGTGDGFSPRKPIGSVDPLDQKFGTPNAGNSGAFRFQIPNPAPAPQPEAPKTLTFPVNSDPEPEYPLINLDEKITSRTFTQRTRLIQRRAWREPEIATIVNREIPAANLGWHPVPAPTQLVRK
jgi:hypothetical protein